MLKFNAIFASQNSSLKEQFHNSLQSFAKTVMDAAQKSILGGRKFRLLNQRELEEIGAELRSEKYHHRQQTILFSSLLAHATYRQGEKDLALNNLFLGIHIWHEQMWVLSVINVFWRIQTVFNESVEISVKNH